MRTCALVCACFVSAFVCCLRVRVLAPHAPQPGRALTVSTRRPPGQRWLVPGCGRGYDVLAAAAAGASAVGLDLAPTAVRDAERHRDATAAPDVAARAEFVAGARGRLGHRARARSTRVQRGHARFVACSAVRRAPCVQAAAWQGRRLKASQASRPPPQTNQTGFLGVPRPPSTPSPLPPPSLSLHRPTRPPSQPTFLSTPTPGGPLTLATTTRSCEGVWGVLRGVWGVWVRPCGG
jgi:hypothetical protein